MIITSCGTPKGIMICHGTKEHVLTKVSEFGTAVFSNGKGATRIDVRENSETSSIMLKFFSDVHAPSLDRELLIGSLEMKATSDVLDLNIISEESPVKRWVDDLPIPVPELTYL